MWPVRRLNLKVTQRGFGANSLIHILVSLEVIAVFSLLLSDLSYHSCIFSVLIHHTVFVSTSL